MKCVILKCNGQFFIQNVELGYWHHQQTSYGLIHNVYFFVVMFTSSKCLVLHKNKRLINYDIFVIKHLFMHSVGLYSVKIVYHCQYITWLWLHIDNVHIYYLSKDIQVQNKYTKYLSVSRLQFDWTWANMTVHVEIVINTYLCIIPVKRRVPLIDNHETSIFFIIIEIL